MLYWDAGFKILCRFVQFYDHDHNVTCKKKKGIVHLQTHLNTIIQFIYFIRCSYKTFIFLKTMHCSHYIFCIQALSHTHVEVTNSDERTKADVSRWVRFEAHLFTIMWLNLTTTRSAFLHFFIVLCVIALLTVKFPASGSSKQPVCRVCHSRTPQQHLCVRLFQRTHSLTWLSTAPPARPRSPTLVSHAQWHTT